MRLVLLGISSVFLLHNVSPVWGQLSRMQASEILLWCATGLRRQDVTVDLSTAHDRCSLQSSCEDHIGSIWDARLSANPSLYNGSKFRLAGFVFPEQRDCTSSAQVTILLGVTDYRDYLGTNLAKSWQELLALDSTCPLRSGHAGRRICVPGARQACATCRAHRCQDRSHHQIVEADARSGSCLANTVGNAAILETSDEHVIYLERSSNVGECQNMFVLPGGHAEPSALGLDSQGKRLELVFETSPAFMCGARDRFSMPCVSVSVT